MKIFKIMLPLVISVPLAAQNVVPDSIDMFSKHLNLNEVVVSGVVGNTKLRTSPLPVQVVTGQTLSNTSSINIIDALTKQPGVSQITTGGGVSKPVIRGLGYNRVVVVKDGIRQEGQQWGDEHGIEIDGNDVGTVEIFKGPASLMYGSDALAGVIIFKPTATPGTDMIKGGFNAEYQTNNGLVGYSLNLSGNNRGFIWDARYSDKFAHANRNRYDGYVPNSQFAERAFSLKAGLSKNWGYSTLKFGYYNLNLGIVEGERDTITGDLDAEPYGSPEAYGFGLPFQRVYHYKGVSETFVNLKNGYLKAVLGFQQNQRKEYEESETDYGLGLRLNTVNYDVRYVSNLMQGWKVSAGANGMAQQSQNTGDEYLVPNYRLFDVGVFGTASKVINRWDFSGGLRFDFRGMRSEALEDGGGLRFHDFSRRFCGLTGSFGATYKFSEQLSAKLNVARGFRAPNISELASNGEHEGTLRYEIGNSQMSPEYSLQTDLGIDYANRLFSVQVSGFVNSVSNFIFARRMDTLVEPDLMTFAYTQSDALLAGFEAAVDFHPVHALHVGGTASYVYTRLLGRSDDMRHLPQTPAPRLTADIKWEISHHAKIFRNAYIAAQADNYLAQNHIFESSGTETATPAYTLINISAGTDVCAKGRKILHIALFVNNLADVGYQNHLSRLKYADINMATGRRGVFDMGRNVVLKIDVPFSIDVAKK